MLRGVILVALILFGALLLPDRDTGRVIPEEIPPATTQCSCTGMFPSPQPGGVRHVTFSDGGIIAVPDYVKEYIEEGIALWNQALEAAGSTIRYQLGGSGPMQVIVAMNYNSTGSWGVHSGNYIHINPDLAVQSQKFRRRQIYHELGHPIGYRHEAANQSHCPPSQALMSGQPMPANTADGDFTISLTCADTAMIPSIVRGDEEYYEESYVDSFNEAPPGYEGDNIVCDVYFRITVVEVSYDGGATWHHWGTYADYLYHENCQELECCAPDAETSEGGDQCSAR